MAEAKRPRRGVVPTAVEAVELGYAIVRELAEESSRVCIGKVNQEHFVKPLRVNHVELFSISTPMGNFWWTLERDPLQRLEEPTRLFQPFCCRRRGRVRIVARLDHGVYKMGISQACVFVGEKNLTSAGLVCVCVMESYFWPERERKSRQKRTENI